jgi:hypothetical protein
MRSVKIKKRSDYNLSGVGVGVLPALAIPQISGGAKTLFSTKWGPPTSAVNSGPFPIRTDLSTIEAANQLQHHMVPKEKQQHDKPIKHTNKRHNFMSIFEKGHHDKKK